MNTNNNNIERIRDFLMYAVSRKLFPSIQRENTSRNKNDRGAE